MMTIYHHERNDVERMKRLMTEHPGRTWMEWEQIGQDTQDEDCMMIAVSLMMEE